MVKEVRLLCVVQLKFEPWTTVVASLQLFIFLRPCYKHAPAVCVHNPRVWIRKGRWVGSPEGWKLWLAQG